MIDPFDHRGKVLRQAVAAHPDSWSADGAPFTSLPTPGTAMANGNVSVAVLLTNADLPPLGSSYAAVAVCGRVPIWQPQFYSSQDQHLGVCLRLFANGSYEVVDAALPKEKMDNVLVLASGILPAHAMPVLDTWHYLSLSFSDDSAIAMIDASVKIAIGPGQMRVSAGGYGLGSLWHTAAFDDVTLDTTEFHSMTPGSWLLDILPGEQMVSNFTGWAGFVLDLSQMSDESLSVHRLGRFKTRGNQGRHQLDIIDSVTRKSMLPNGTVSVDYSSCNRTDALGFCYSSNIIPAAKLATGAVYYVLSSEVASADAFLRYTPLLIICIMPLL